jgi:cytochrome c
MDSFELNKILGAILGTLLFVMGIGFLAEAIYEPIKGQGPGYALPEPTEQTGDGGDTTTTPTVADIGTLLAKADIAAGQASAKKCQACHDFTSGGPNKTGPNLYDVVERVIGSHPGFGYSQVLADDQKAGKTWSYEALNAWLTSPKAFAPGTKMSYAGDKDDQDRANIIAFLSTLSASPKPFPAPANPDGAAPAEQTTEGTASEAARAASAPASSEAAPAAAETSSSAAPASSEASSSAAQ